MKSPEGLKKYHAVAGLIAVAIPFAAMLLMIGANVQRISHSEYRFAIEGYDPRDLLRGHYLIFRYKWPEASANSCVAGSEGCCACITGEGHDPAVSFAPCASVETGDMCKGVIEVGDFWGGDFQPAEALRQYYIPEAQAPALEEMLRKGEHRFEAGLVPQPGKGGQLKMLYIDDKPLPQFLADMAPVP